MGESHPRSLGPGPHTVGQVSVQLSMSVTILDRQQHPGLGHWEMLGEVGCSGPELWFSFLPLPLLSSSPSVLIFFSLSASPLLPLFPLSLHFPPPPPPHFSSQPEVAQGGSSCDLDTAGPRAAVWTGMGPLTGLGWLSREGALSPVGQGWLVRESCEDYPRPHTY